ncbi:MAG: hypothetical protein LBN95_07370 [Prevotellaceae bacterium]|jgi:hypothetical protein|nr:hypothetical protein [Prevotellaceae bacterium]
MKKKIFICLSAICALYFVSCETENDRQRAMIVGKWNVEKYTVNDIVKEISEKWYQFNENGTASVYYDKYTEEISFYHWNYKNNIFHFYGSSLNYNAKIELLTQDSLKLNFILNDTLTNYILHLSRAN